MSTRRYCITVELWDLVSVEIEGSDDANSEDLLDLVHEHFMEHGYPEVFLDFSRKTAEIVPKGSEKEERFGWGCGKGDS